jgi:hypothetical protein
MMNTEIRQYARRARPTQGLGDTITDLTTILTKVPDALPVIVQAVSDPAFPAILDRVKTMQAIQEAEAQKNPPPRPPGLPSSLPTPVGLGLDKAIRPFDMYLYYLKHPWAPWVIVGGTVLTMLGVGFGIGYAVGRRHPKKPS